jgi:hypothetical protein
MLRDHDRWVVASQECDLDLTDVTESTPTVELRPVFAQEPPAYPDWGIRSRRFLLSADDYVEAPSSHTLISANLLSVLLEQGAQRDAPLPDNRSIAFKRWLGLRYDRPAVPPEFGPLAKRIATEVEQKRRRPIGRRVRDVLMQFQADAPPRFSLFAVLADEVDRTTVREWLVEIARSVPRELGIGDQFEAEAAEAISLHLVETSYAADVTQVTWRREEPEGAF